MRYFLIAAILLCLLPSTLAVTNVSVDGITQHAARIHWTTDVATSSNISYGLTTNYGNNTYSSTRLTDHTWFVTGLAPGAQYHFCLHGLKADNTDIGCAQDFTFTTQLQTRDGPEEPELPREYVDTSMPTMNGDEVWVDGTNCNDATTGLQARIDAAQGGDTIIIPAGTQCVGTYFLRARVADDTDWIIIRTSTSDSQLPQGTRIVPEQTQLMPTIMGNGLYFVGKQTNPQTTCGWFGKGSLSFARINGSASQPYIIHRCMSSTLAVPEEPYSFGTTPPETCEVGEWFYIAGNYGVNEGYHNYAYQCVYPNTWFQKDVNTANHIGDDTLTAVNGAHHYRLIGIELTHVPVANRSEYELDIRLPQRVAGGHHVSMLTLAPGSHDIIVDRSYVHGQVFPSRSMFAIKTAADDWALVDSRIDRMSMGMKNINGQRDVGIATYLQAGGPGKIVNNYIDGAGILIFADGGGEPIPHDFEIRHNYVTSDPRYFEKAPEYDGIFYNNRHRFELKRGIRFLIDSNVFENNWAVENQGALLLFSPRGAYANTGVTRNNTLEVSDMTVTNNVLRHGAVMVYMLGNDDTISVDEPFPKPGGRFKFDNNLAYDIDGYYWSSPQQYLGISATPGIYFMMGLGLSEITITHNTLINNEGYSKHFIWSNSGLYPNADLNASDNIITYNDTGWNWFITGPIRGVNRYHANFLNHAFVSGPNASWIFNNNVVGWENNNINTLITNNPSTTSWERNIATIGFEDAANLDFSLSDASPYKGAASDGTDPGVDWSAIEQTLQETANPTYVPNVAAPVRSNGSPTRIVLNPDYANISVSTDISSSCRYSTTPNTAYASMVSQMQPSTGISFRAQVAVAPGNNTFYVRCSSGIANTNDYTIQFIVFDSDLNGDGKRNIRDLILLLHKVQRNDLSADLNADGVLNVLDLQRYISYLLR